ncbi:hypothetical protein QQS21_004720 [Conoideocrella luteorostrata]|uniref:Uncharacterized protein n=1 Tax=Conoideocrella luteorostrata TaxID=1105319 RepID=A0AAJ0CQU9_9HYPO|nr:hypothetical protein QQS21_004720 [Conoideocrella luteorostrata]
MHPSSSVAPCSPAVARTPTAVASQSTAGRRQSEGSRAKPASGNISTPCLVFHLTFTFGNGHTGSICIDSGTRRLVADTEAMEKMEGRKAVSRPQGSGNQSQPHRLAGTSTTTNLPPRRQFTIVAPLSCRRALAMQAFAGPMWERERFDFCWLRRWQQLQQQRKVNMHCIALPPLPWSSGKTASSSKFSLGWYDKSRPTHSSRSTHISKTWAQAPLELAFRLESILFKAS